MPDTATTEPGAITTMPPSDVRQLTPADRYVLEPTVPALSEAMAKAQAEMEHPHFDCVNVHFKSRYASLAAISRAVRGPLNKHGLRYWQEAENDPTDMSKIRVRVCVSHESGEVWRASWLSMKAKDSSPQAVKACVTYLQRTTLMLAFGVVGDDDDDANSAQPKQQPRSQPPRREPVKPADDRLSKIRELVKQAIGLTDKDRVLQLVSMQCEKDIKTAADIPGGKIDKVLSALSQFIVNVSKDKGATE